MGRGPHAGRGEAGHERRGIRVDPKRIAEARKRAGLSQNELNRRLGMHKSYMSKLEHGAWANPGSDVVANIAEILQCPITDLCNVDLTPEPAPEVSALMQGYCEWAEALEGLLADGQDRIARLRQALSRLRDQQGGDGNASPAPDSP